MFGKYIQRTISNNKNCVNTVEKCKHYDTEFDDLGWHKSLLDNKNGFVIYTRAFSCSFLCMITEICPKKIIIYLWLAAQIIFTVDINLVFIVKKY